MGYNPLGEAATRGTLRVLVAHGMGEYLMNGLRKFESPYVKEVRGRGLLCKDTHNTIIRFAPLLVITRPDIDWSLEQISDVLHMD